MEASLHISAADLGTNTVKILHAVRDAHGAIDRIQHVSNTIRLGAGIETTGRIEPERIDACVSFLREQEVRGRELGSTAFIGVATEAFRVASNGQELLQRIRQETAWQVRMISGMEEAELTFLGLRDQVPTGAPAAIVDIGGGSTEVIVVENDNVTWQQSLAIGSGRLADRFFDDDPPGMEATARAFADAIAFLSPLDQLPVQPETILFSGGNGVFLQTLIEQLFEREPVTVHSTERLLQHLSTTPARETADRLGIMLARARVLPAGVAIALAVLTKTRASKARGVMSGIQLGLITNFTAQTQDTTTPR